MNRKIFLGIAFLFLLSACNNNNDDDLIPYVFIQRDINLNNQEYLPLAQDGGYVYLDDEGVKGLIIYRKSFDVYHAFERNCPYKPSESCSVIDVDASLLFMMCSCCSSQFNFEGEAISGPSAWGMKKYKTTLSGSYLRITN